MIAAENNRSICACAGTIFVQHRIRKLARTVNFRGFTMPKPMGYFPSGSAASNDSSSARANQRNRRRLIVALLALTVLATEFTLVSLRLGPGKAALFVALSVLALGTFVIFHGFFLRVIAGTLGGASMGAAFGMIAAAVCFCFPSIAGTIHWEDFIEFVVRPALVVGILGCFVGCLTGAYWLGGQF
jgi:hypothetical protein